jgi:hypothetical protein
MESTFLADLLFVKQNLLWNPPNVGSGANRATLDTPLCRYAGNVTFICSGTLQLNSPIGTHSVQMLVHSGAAPILQEHVGSISQTYSLFKKLIGLRFDACEKSLCNRRTFIGQLHPFVSLLLWPAWRDRPQSLCCVWLEGEGRVCRLKAYDISLAGLKKSEQLVNSFLL